MKSLFALGWRLLLVFALVANPLAAAVAAPCHEGAAPVAETGRMPPCHQGGMVDAATTDSTAPAGPHDHDCGKAGCDFGGCCASCVLAGVAIASLMHAPMHDVGHAAGAHALDGPSLPPLIRPPIA